ncbi:MAG: N-acetylmuramic acid 6-phosphate etherase, partial [Erysipelotrichaceae bacterium]|nr:N-acetylmuramic acid 6-phosphate etherase [Erysipelotrichaceae bacterium]
MVNLNGIVTETRNEKTKEIDLLSVEEILKIMNEEDLNVVAAIKNAIPQIEALINETIKAYKNGGRIIYIGAGTSGRMGLMDAVEVVPTFNSERFVGLIAGGDMAFVKAVEGAEDSK